MFSLLLAAILSALNPPDTQPEISLGLLIFPPHVVINPQTGECEGFAIDTVRTLLPEFKVTPTCAPPARIFKLIESGDIDMTINIKSTPAVRRFVEFVDPPYTLLELKLYGHRGQTTPGSISAIRGFDYHGERARLIADGYVFVDLPNALSAVSMFTRERTDYLLSYAAPTTQMQVYFPKDTVSQTLLSVPTHLAISKISSHRHAIKAAIQVYITEHDITYLLDVLTPAG